MVVTRHGIHEEVPNARGMGSAIAICEQSLLLVLWILPKATTVTGKEEEEYNCHRSRKG